MMYDKTDSETGLGDKKDTDKGQGIGRAMDKYSRPTVIYLA